MTRCLQVAPLILLLALGVPWSRAQPVHAPGAGDGAAAAVDAVAAERVVRYIAGEVSPVYYVVERRPVVRTGPGTGATRGRLDFRRGVRVGATDGAWRLVYDIESGEQLGWVEHRALSNVWLLIDKQSRELFVYRGTELVRRLPVDVSINPEGHKVRRAAPGETYHYRIPEGYYFISGRNPNSQYYRSFMINYPNVEDADRGLAAGLISRSQHVSIVRASERFETPTFATSLGGAIAIHGQGSGRQRAWTRGCVALRDVHIDLLWDIVQVGTPVLIR